MKTFLLAALMILGSQAFATDAYEVKNLGFSADGRYYAFVEHVIQDGSGFPAAYGQVIDVTANKVVVAKRIVLETENGSEKEAIRQVINALAPQRFGIDGRNPGQTLWVRVDTDLSAPVKTATFSPNYWVDGGASSVTPKMQLEVTEIAMPENEDCLGYGSNKINVRLSNLTWNSSRVLQNDVALPSLRKCASQYQIRRVLTHKKSIAAVLRYETLGFEGPDYHHMIVTGANAVEN